MSMKCWANLRYMKWLFQQLEGPVYVAGWEEREDCTVVDIPRALAESGKRRKGLEALSPNTQKHRT